MKKKRKKTTKHKRNHHQFFFCCFSVLTSPFFSSVFLSSEITYSKSAQAKKGPRENRVIVPKHNASTADFLQKDYYYYFFFFFWYFAHSTIFSIFVNIFSSSSDVGAEVKEYFLELPTWKGWKAQHNDADVIITCCFTLSHSLSLSLKFLSSFKISLFPLPIISCCRNLFSFCINCWLLLML